MLINRLTSAYTALLTVALVLSVGCAPAPAPFISPVDSSLNLQVVIVPSELVVGENRFAIGLVEPGKGLVKNAEVRFRYFDLTNESSPLLESEADAARLTTPDGMTVIFAHERAFDRAGAWGIEVQARLGDGKTSIQRIKVSVQENSATKKVGELAPKLETPTRADVSNDLSKLTSATQPNAAFYESSLAHAIQSGKPTVFVLATPAFCQTRFCGPVYDVVSGLESKYGDAFKWVHVEVFTGLPNPAANNFQTAPAMRAFGLTTEPWVFVIDKNGRIVYRVEGPVTSEEIERRLIPLI